MEKDYGQLGAYEMSHSDDMVRAAFVNEFAGRLMPHILDFFEEVYAICFFKPTFNEIKGAVEKHAQTTVSHDPPITTYDVYGQGIELALEKLTVLGVVKKIIFEPHCEPRYCLARLSD
jgi:hypothetical protein